MVKRKRTGPLAERYVEETLALIAERGSSNEVNVREISRRIGCAHTNVYNYFGGREELLWAAFHQALLLYAESLTHGLDASLSGHAYFRRLMGNMVEWPLENPGLHRFISSDPLDPEQIPKDILETVEDFFEGIKEFLKGVKDVFEGSEEGIFK